MYLSALPQFITPGHGSVLAQSVALGTCRSPRAVNAVIAMLAGSIAGFLAGRHKGAAAALDDGRRADGLAAKMAWEGRK
jgi:threonine/homoserine/homoserine lactone efflux protein